MMTALSRLPILLPLTVIVSLAMLIPMAHALGTGEARLAAAFAETAAAGLLGAALVGIARWGRGGASDGQGVLLAIAAAFLGLPLLMAVPLTVALPDTGLFNAWWEMLSCLTTTGATLYAPDRLPDSLHLWRGVAGWLGGLFMLVAAIALMAPLRVGGFEILGRDDSGGQVGAGVTRPGQRSRRGRPVMEGQVPPALRLARWAVAIAPVYAALTLAMWVATLMAGETALDGLMWSMGTLSTSGISARAGSIGGHSGGAGGGLMTEAVVALFLILALSRRPWPGGNELAVTASPWRDPEYRMAAGLVALVTVALIVRPLLGLVGAAEPVGGEPAVTAPGFWGDLAHALAAAWGAAFTALSYLTTTGWSSVAWDGARAWSGFSAPGLMLAGLAIMGGGIATTAGGVKLLRVYALARHSQRELQRIVHPDSVGGGGGVERRLREGGAYLAFIFFMLFAVTIAVLMALVSLRPITFETATILSVAALTNTGPLAEAIPLMPVFDGSAGIAGAPWGGWAGLPRLTKGVLAIAMVAGRIEILAILALLSPGAWRR